MVFKHISGDGDNSVTKKLNEVLLYGSDFKIQKIECENHLMRNYCTKLTVLAFFNFFIYNKVLLAFAIYT